MRQLFAAALIAAPLFTADGPAFEAASVKVNREPNPRGIAFQILPSGRVHIANVPLYVIIALAYDVPFQSQTQRLSGGPDWVRSETYDIEATTGGLPPEMTATARTRG